MRRRSRELARVRPLLVTRLGEATRRPRRVAVGKFDGLHAGHRAIVAGCDTVLTFDPHPLAVLRPDVAPKLLASPAVRAERLTGLGVTEMVLMPFDATAARQSARDFVDQVLVDRLGAVEVSVGANFRFGHRATGDVELLRADPRFATRVAPLVRRGGDVVSSSRLRALVEAGDVERVATLLGAPLQLPCRAPAAGGRLRLDGAFVRPAPGCYQCLVLECDGRVRSAVEVRLEPGGDAIVAGRAPRGATALAFVRRLNSTALRAVA